MSHTALVILDNCEHAIEACAALATTLLSGCPRVRILATSRAPLDVPGEVLWHVPPLSLPDSPAGDAAGPAFADLERSDAVRLFVERARASLPSFQLNERNGPAVLRICAGLDGIPLAIELAAGRVRALGVDDISARLHDGLLGGSGHVDPRHRSLRAVTDWSHDLLSADERILFRRLAVFAGGWSLSAAEAVCSDCGDGGSPGPAVIGTVAIARLMIQLVDQSLVMADTRWGEARYRFLETVRQYAADRLAESGEEETLRRRHLDWCLALVEEASHRLYGRDQAVWRERLARDEDNLRSAIEFSRRRPEGAEAELRLVGLLYRFWYLQHEWNEASRRLDDALERRHAVDRSVLPKALQGAVFFAWRRGDAQRAAALGAEALAVSAACGDRRGHALVLNWLSALAVQQGDPAKGDALAGRAVAEAEALGDRWLMCLALSNVVNVARHLGDYAAALRHAERGLELSREADDDSLAAGFLRSIGKLALHQRNYERAAAAFRASLHTYRDFKWVVEECLLGLAQVAAAGREYERTATLLGALSGMRDALSHRSVPADEAEYERCTAITSKRLGEIRFRSAAETGRRMPFDDAIAYALAPRLVKPHLRGRGAGRATARRPGGLTARELDVASLIADGLTNPEIASRLGTSPRTVSVHVEHILAKLGVKSRTQVAAWAGQLGLEAAGSGERDRAEPHGA